MQLKPGPCAQERVRLLGQHLQALEPVATGGRCVKAERVTVQSVTVWRGL